MSKLPNVTITETGYVNDAMKKKLQEVKAKNKKQTTVTQVNNNNRVITVNRSK